MEQCMKNSVSNLHKKKQNQNNLKKGSIKIEIKKILIVGIHDNIKPIPDCAEPPTNSSSVPIVCELDRLLSGTLQILKKNNDAVCIIIELYL